MFTQMLSGRGLFLLNYIVFLFCFETGYFYIALTVLELSMWNRDRIGFTKNRTGRQMRPEVRTQKVGYLSTVGMVR